jgi:hypothetical protein
VTSENPYRKPIQAEWRRLRGIRWTMPFLPQTVIALTLLVIMAALCVLYATIGIAAQICVMCLMLIGDEAQQFKQAVGAERSAYLVAMVICGIVFAAFWLVQTPVLLLGWGIHRLNESPRRLKIRRPAFGRTGYISARFSDSRR